MNGNTSRVPGAPDNYTNLLLDFFALPQTPRHLTIFAVGGFPHYENAISNVLRFYLDPHGEHGMGTLLLDSILALTCKEALDRATNIHIEREFPTKKGGYLDILIKTPVHVVGIENKINAGLYNDLNDYWATINDEAAKEPSRTPVGIVLSAHTFLNLPGEWQNLTYARLWEDVKSKLGHRIQKGDSKWLLYLIDLMNTTANPNFTLSPREEFFDKCYDAIKQLLNERESLLSKLHSRLAELQTLIETCPVVRCSTKHGIFEKDYLFYDFSSHGHTIGLALWIYEKGWEFGIFTRDKSPEYLKSLLKDTPKKVTIEDNRFIIDRWPLKKPLDEIQSDVCTWMQWLTK